MVKASVPNFFICPISLQLMKDPVTLTTGQTYDRRSIEKWFAEGHNTCPSTMQLLSSRDIAPNLTLQSLIQRWCTANNYGCVAAAALVVPGVSLANAGKRRPVMQIVQGVAYGAEELHDNLKELRSLVRDLNQGSRNRTVLAEAGAIPVLASFIFSPENLAKDVNACEDALEILTLLPPQDVRKLVHIGTKQLTAISWFLNRGSIDGRVNAALLLSTLADEDNEMKASVGNTAGIFEGLVQLMKEDLYLKAVASGLKAIFSLLSNGQQKNVIRAVEAGLVFAVVDRLLETESRSQLQILTKLMELLCSSRKGMEEVVSHALVVPLLARIIVNNITSAAVESAVTCLWSICQHFPNKCVDEAAGQVGLLMQLTHLLESGDHQINRVYMERVAQILQQLQDSLKNCTPIS